MPRSPEEAKIALSRFPEWVIVSHKNRVRGSSRLSDESLKRGIYFRMNEWDYAGSPAMDFDRLLSRTCSVVNSRPQTLQRQPGAEKAAIPAMC